MLGSSASISGPNVILNTAVAEELKQFADILESADDFETALHDLIRDTIRDHKRIIFNGNGYDDAWLEEAEKRGLLNLRTTPDALPCFLHEKNVKLFTSHKVFSEEEMQSRYEIMMENYVKVLHIEALTMAEMAERDILPAVSGYAHSLTDTVLAKRSLGAEIDTSYEYSTVKKISSLTASAYEKLETLKRVCQRGRHHFRFREGGLLLQRYGHPGHGRPPRRLGPAGDHDRHICMAIPDLRKAALWHHLGRAPCL